MIKQRRWFNICLTIFVTTLAFSVVSAHAVVDLIPYPVITAPVVHAGKYHILQAGGTYVMLDRTRGLAIAMVGQAESPGKVCNSLNGVIEDMSLHATVNDGGVVNELDQVNATDAVFRVIAQGPDYAAARVFFSLCKRDGIPRGNVTLDIYVYPGRIFLIPSMFLESEKSGAFIMNANLHATIMGKQTSLKVNNKKIEQTRLAEFIPFGDKGSGFSVAVSSSDRPALKMGWLRNQYPNWMYLNETDGNPEIDDLYDNWPPWITQRHGTQKNTGTSLSWLINERSGFTAEEMKNGLKKFSFAWVNGSADSISPGRYAAYNGVMSIFINKDAARLEEQWNNHEHPSRPTVQAGDLRYYNQFEGSWELNSHGHDVDVTFGSSDSRYDREVFLRIWNLAGKGGFEVKQDGKPVPFGLLNDGKLIEDPLVSIDHDVLNATGPAKYAVVSFIVPKGRTTRLTLAHKPGIQFTYQMHSNKERYEAWSDACGNRPLFSVYLGNGNVYEATLPGVKDFSFYMWNLYWSAGPRPTRCLNNIRGFRVLENGIERVTFRLESVEQLGTGLSTYTISVPFERRKLTFNVDARFKALGDVSRWRSFEICNVYPFDSVARGDFYHKDYIFLKQGGVFDRMGTGAWSSRFETIIEPEQDGYYGKSVRREGAGSHVPRSADGTVWMFGGSTDRGNVMFRLGDHKFSQGATLGLGICNAWVDINHNLSRRNPTEEEHITYTLDVFGGRIPSIEKLNELYTKAAGDKVVKQITGVVYDQNGTIGGFSTK